MKILPFAIFKIEGESMLPDFHPGDFIAVNQWAYLFRSPKAVDVVALKDPRSTRRIIVKRVVRVEKGQIFVRGDNEGQSTDSRAFGLVAQNKVVGKVLLCFSGNSKKRSSPENKKKEAVQ